ncbi:MAG TPA: hypothetical protein VJ806_07790 [Luteimonas sp.]|nr:hypothetical protein [Luteimonas sp.]
MLTLIGYGLDGWKLLPLLAIAIFLATAVHELGHVCAAKAGSMQPILMGIWQLGFLFKRKGMSARWIGMMKGIGGFVIAYPHPDRPLRPAMLGFIAGGASANFSMAILCWCVASLATDDIAGFCVASFWINACFGLANLIPAQFGGYANDGLQFWHWLRQRDPYPEHALFMRLMGRSVFGDTADKLPVEDVDRLEASGGAMVLVADWIRVKSAQNRAEWASVSALALAFETRVDEMPAAFRRGMDELIEVVRAEAAFSRALSERDASPIHALKLSPRANWLSPHLQPRLAALVHALRGEPAQARQALQASQTWAERSVDRALHRSEPKMRAAVEALLSDEHR